jgi:crossover junction endodeoxyribonuclease RuvC
MNERASVGVDPGLSGAIAFLDKELNLVSLFDMPVMPVSKGRNQVNAAALAMIFRRECDLLHPPVAYLEAVSAMPKQGVSSMFSFGTSYGIVQGVLAALEIPVVLVRPQVWKARAGLTGKEKDYCRTLIQRLYPAADLNRKKDIGRADAIAIARWGDKI